MFRPGASVIFGSSFLISPMVRLSVLMKYTFICLALGELVLVFSTSILTPSLPNRAEKIAGIFICGDAPLSRFPAPADFRARLREPGWTARWERASRARGFLQS